MTIKKLLKTNEMLIKFLDALCDKVHSNPEDYENFHIDKDFITEIVHRPLREIGDSFSLSFYPISLFFLVGADALKDQVLGWKIQPVEDKLDMLLIYWKTHQASLGEKSIFVKTSQEVKDTVRLLFGQNYEGI